VIEDLFFKRYAHRRFNPTRDLGGVHPGMQRVVSQAAQIFASDLVQQLELNEDFFASVQQKLVRELGVWPFPEGRSALDTCGRFLTEPYDWRQNRHGSVDTFVKARLSMIELLYRSVEKLVEKGTENLTETEKFAKLRWAARLVGAVSPEHRNVQETHAQRRETVREAIQELNARFRAADIPLHYHNGLIQLAEDNLSQDRIAEPFWSITSDPKWKNVEDDMKRAVDLADTGGPDAAFYATRALESTIKIISGEKGWTRGNENGAAAFIDNLVS
jgi:AbiJ N-terminal domain 4